MPSASSMQCQCPTPNRTSSSVLEGAPHLQRHVVLAYQEAVQGAVADAHYCNRDVEPRGASCKVRIDFL